MTPRAVLDPVKKNSPKRLLKCAALVKRDAMRSMKKGGGKKHTPSAVGVPPHAQLGNLRSSIQHALTGITAIVGPTEKYGAVHEFGSRTHPQRPFMRPALLRTRTEFADQFKDLI